jgi:hypothetical protein
MATKVPLGAAASSPRLRSNLLAPHAVMVAATARTRGPASRDRVPVPHAQDATRTASRRNAPTPVAEGARLPQGHRCARSGAGIDDGGSARTATDPGVTRPPDRRAATRQPARASARVARPTAPHPRSGGHGPAAERAGLMPAATPAPTGGGKPRHKCRYAGGSFPRPRLSMSARRASRAA